MSHTPPRVARLLLARLLETEDGAELIDDLDGEFDTRATRSVWWARAWYWRQVFRLDVLRLRRELRLARTAGVRPTLRIEERPASLRTALGTTLYDLRFALRTLVRQPGFTATVVITLALGIGANTAIFSVVHGVLLKPLPYPEPERLAFVWVESVDGSEMLFSGPGAADFADEMQSFSGVARVYGGGRGTVDMGDGIEEAVTLGVEHNALSVYGHVPVLGRNFVAADRTPLSVAQMRDADLVRPTGAIVLSHEYWVRRFGGDSSVVGRIVMRGGYPAQILGVQPPRFVLHMPAAIGGARSADLWFLPYWDQTLFPRNGAFVRVVARLAPGVTFAQAQAEADAFARRQRAQYPEQRNRNYGVRIVPLHSTIATDSARPVLILFGAVGFVMLIACANVANLSLAQAMAREREWVLRASVGAGRGRLIRQSLTESAILAGAGGVIGLAIAWWGVPALLQLSPTALPRAGEIGIDVNILVFTAGVAGVATVLFGLVPALRTAGTDAADVLRGRGISAHRGQRRLRSSLVVGEIALALVLVTGTGLLLRSFVELMGVDPGFDPDGVVTASISPTSQYHPTPETRVAFYRDLHERFAALPGVTAVGIAQPLPFRGLQIWNVGYRTATGVAERRTGLRQWFPGTFEALRMQLRAGRFLTWDDFNDVNRFTAVVDDRLAEQLWPGEDPLGKQVRLERREYGETDEIWFEQYWADVVGVVGAIRGGSLDQDDLPSVFVTFHQNPWATGEFAVRAEGDPAAVMAGMRAALGEVTTAYPLSDPGLLGDQVAQSLGPERFSLSLISLFGFLSLAMAFVGIYGVIAYGVRQRSGEFGTRLALGADRAAIVRLVLGEGLRVIGVGLALGFVAAIAMVRVLQNQLYNVAATDPLTFVSVAVLLLMTGVAACYVPARRASGLDPVEILRTE